MITRDNNHQSPIANRQSQITCPHVNKVEGWRRPVEAVKARQPDRYLPALKPAPESSTRAQTFTHNKRVNWRGGIDRKSGAIKSAASRHIPEHRFEHENSGTAQSSSKQTRTCTCTRTHAYAYTHLRDYSCACVRACMHANIHHECTDKPLQGWT